MSYNVKNSKGQTVAVVSDKQIDTTSTSLNLVGQMATNYGLAHAENFLRLLENFAAPAAPENPVEGQLWYNSSAGTLKIRKGTTWVSVGGNAVLDGQEGTPANNLAGIYTSSLTILNTSIILMFAGGDIIAVISPIDIESNNIPATVIVNGTTYSFQSRFAQGILAGINLSDASPEEPTADVNYIFNGKVNLAESATYAGGGTGEIGAWTALDLGANTILLAISSTKMVAVYADAVIPNSSLPATISVGGYTNILFKSVFPSGLGKGMTFATGYGILGYPDQQSVATMVANEASARASAINAVYTWVDSNSATAQSLTSLISAFTTNTGQSTVAQAVQYLVTLASDNSSSAEAVTALKSEFVSATGTSNWSDALTKVSAGASAGLTSAQRLDSLTSTFTTTTGQSNIASAVQLLWTRANEQTSFSGWSVLLDSNGFQIGIEALNGGQQNNIIKVRTDRFQIGDATGSAIPFEIVGGVVYIKAAVIKELTIGTNKIANDAITFRRAVSMGAPIYGTDTITYWEPITYNFTLSTPGKLIVQLTAAQGYTGFPSGGISWSISVNINGTIDVASIAQAGGAGFGTDSVACSGHADLPAGNYTARVIWQGNSTFIRLMRCTLILDAAFK